VLYELIEKNFALRPQLPLTGGEKELAR